MKKKLLLLIAITLFGMGNVFAQKTTSSYKFSTGTTTYGGDLGLSYTTLIGANQDNVSSGARNLPFTFNYLGQTYTQFSLTDNGLLSVMNPGDAALTGNETTNAMAAASPGIKIAPYWDDLSTGTNGYVKYAVYSGTMYINWRVTIPKSAGGAANAEFQVRMSASGGVSFYYGSTAAPWPSFQNIAANAGGYSIGIGNSSTDFQSVSVTGAKIASSAFGIANDANTLAIPGPFSIYFTPDNTAPTISNQLIPNSAGTANRTLTKTIGDGSGTGIPTSGSYIPRIYFNKNGGDYFSTQGAFISGTAASGTWEFTVDHSLLGGVVQGDVIYYYVAAQDLAFNVGSYPAGVVATDVNTVTTHPTSPSTYIIPSEYSGTKTVGVGGDFTSITNSGGLFDNLNAGTLIGDLTVNIISDMTSETGTVALSAWTDGAGGPYTVTINPVGARTVSGTTAATGLIYLNGAKNLIIDGLNTGGNSLAISNMSTSYTALNILNGSNNNIIRNTTLTANGGSVITFGTFTTNVNFNNSVRNCIITSGTTVPSTGISFNGSTTYDSYDNVIDNNKIINFSVSGITMGNGYINTTISNNEIYNAIPSGTSLNGITLGTYYGAGIYNVFNNYIHDLNPALTTSTGTVNGIYYTQSSYSTPYDVLNIHNNVISLDATTSNTNITLNGIWLGGGSSSYVAQANVHYNSIYIGGTGIVAGTSTGLKVGGTNYRSTNTITNNAIYNARSGGSGIHYGVSYYYNNSLVSNTNNIFVSGTNGVFGYYLTADYTTLSAWQTASAQDEYSYSGNPGFTSPTNLLPDPLNPNSAILDNHGIPVATIGTDILGNSRSVSMPVLTDIGAYENATTSSTDIFRPAITLTPIADTGLSTNQSTTAIITDGIGVSGGANLPRIYYKKASDANVFGGNTSLDNGWKYTLATNTTSPYEFTVDNSLLFGGTVSPGDAVLYFIVAQDDAGNFVSSAPGAVANAIDPVQNVTAAPEASTLNAYLVLNNNIAGTINVPGNYASLTGTAGLFDSMNKGTVTGNINVLITDNLIEPGTVGLNEFPSPFTMTIKPASASLKTITGDIDDGLIRFNGTDRVTIDGRFEGAGKYLEFNNTKVGTFNTTTFYFTASASYNNLQYLTIKGQSPAGAVIKMYNAGAAPGNSYNLIDNCDITNSGTSNPQMGVYAYSTNTFNSLTNCNISNFTTNGLHVGSLGSNWTITGNSFYQTAPITINGEVNVLLIWAGTNHVINGNYIGGSAPLAQGTWTIDGGTGGYFRGIYFYNATNTFTVTNNTITNFARTTSSVNGFYGISMSNGGTVTGNTIGSSTSADAIVLNYTGTSTSSSYGIYVSVTNFAWNISNNTVGGIKTEANSTLRSNSFIGLYCNGGSATINNNTIGSLTVPNSIYASNASTSTTAQSILGISTNLTIGSSNISNNTIANLTNNYAGTSTTGYVRGISTGGAGVQNIFGNTVVNLSTSSPMAGTAASSSVIGIVDISTGVNKTIGNNMVRNMANTSGSQTSSIIGIYAGGGYGIFSNNVVNIGLDALENPVSTGYSIAGIYHFSGASSFYFNTVNIVGGFVNGVTSPTFAMYFNNTFSNLKNNILSNNRSGGTTGKHYALRLANVSTNLDNNDYYVAGGFLAMLGTTDYTDFPTWQSTAVAGKDIASLNVNPLFLSPSVLTPTNSLLAGAGVAIAGITTDYLGTTRSATPTIGAYETIGVCTSPTSGGTIDAPEEAVGCEPFDPTTILSSLAASGQSGQINYVWQQSTTDASTGFTDIEGSDVESYDPGALTATTWFKRLAKANCDPDFSAAQVSNVVMITVNPLADDAGPITGSETLVMGATAVPYSVAPIANATDYVWSYSGTGATINGTGTDVTIDFAIDATEGTLSVKGTNACGEGVASTLDILSFKALNLKVMLQGLWNSSNANMDLCKTADGITPNFSGTIADTISVELHDATSYGTIVHQIHGLELNQDGTVNTTGKTFVEIPSVLSGTYYVTVKTRNHVETTSAAGVSFSGSIIDYDFTSNATQAYGNNQVLLSTGVYGLYLGELNFDGYVNISDRGILLTDLNAALTGYFATDINGDGFVNTSDRELLLLNLNAAITSILPIP